MPLSNLRSVKPTATFNLEALLAAVRADKSAYAQQADSAPAWARESSPPGAMFNALSRVEQQLVEWQQDGVKEVTAQAPFSDGDLTGNINDTITAQFRDNRVTPIVPTAG